jgi:hypothetical protein
MEQFISLALVVFTSAGAYLIGRRRLGLSRHAALRALRKMLEAVGATLIFFAVNLVAGMALILTTRILFGIFAPMSLANDMALLPLSLFQALAFQWWREARKPAVARGDAGMDGGWATAVSHENV